MLGQRATGIALEECGDDTLAIEEVLGCYVLWKYLRGASSRRVLYKIRMLIYFLRVTNRAHIVEIGADQFKIHCIEAALGGGRIGLSACMTVPGKKLINIIRSALSKAGRTISTGRVYGGPLPVENFLTAEQRDVWDHELRRDAWAERYFATRPQLFPCAPEYVSASQRVTTLPQYRVSQEISRELRLAVQDVEDTISYVSAAVGAS